MNKNLYRIVFNKARGLLMVVAEIASASGKGDSSAGNKANPLGRIFRVHFAKLRLMAFAAKVAAGALTLAIPLAHAQVVVDHSAPAAQQATLLKTANGTIQVDIRTPSAAGVSRNTYSQFDVNHSGVILNNARAAAQTQIGGWVQANPWLANGSARVILNEVNSSAPSQLRGYVEVAGGRAQVVIANPAGISCNGCGFINADRTTLTTGTPIINGGNLDGYLVRQGTVTVTGNGLDTSRSTYTDIISRAVQINAGIWANDLKVTAGANRVNAANTQAIPVSGSDGPPAFAIDVAQLGGMYANKITLVGTEAGLGVRNAGQIGASAGNVVVTVDGKLENSGQLASEANTALQASGDVVNTGSIYAGGNLDAQGQGDINNESTIAAGGNLSLAATGNASRIVNTADAVIGSGINSDGTLASSGDLTIAATNDIHIQGQSISGGDQTIQGTILDLQNSQVSGRNLGMFASIGDIDLSHANVQATNDINANAAAGTLNNTDGLLSANGTLGIVAATVVNNDTSDAGKGIQAKTIRIAADQVSNTKGAILADDTVALTGAGAIDNTQGLISAVKNLSLTDTNAQTSNPKTLSIGNTAGSIIAGESLSIDSHSLSGDGKLLSGGNLAAKLDSDYDNTGEFQANGTASLETSGKISNQSTIAAGDTLTLKAASIDNHADGEISADKLALTATDAHTLTNRGLIDGHETVIETVTLKNIGAGRIYGDHVAIGATDILNDTETVDGVTKSGTIASRDRLDIGAANIVNREHATIMSMGDMFIGGQLDGDKHAIGQATLLANNSATIESQGGLDITAQSIQNTNEHFATQVAVVSNGSLTQYQGAGSPNRYGPGQVSTYEDQSIHLSTPDGNYESWSRYDIHRTVTETQVTQSDPGVISAANGMNITADTVLNDKSKILAGGDIVGNIETLTNTTVSGQRKTTDSGSVTSYWRHREKGRDSTSSSTAAYAPAATIQTISLAPTVFQQNATPIASGTSIASHAAITVNQTVQGKDNTTIAAGIVNTAVPGGSMFAEAPDPSASYLIETDPQFSSYRSWLSSDYMLQQLSLDPAVTQKRLGDGFYEQKLVREQVAQLTGRRFLDGYASDEQEYRALIDNGVATAAQMNLRPGIALTAAQMAALTTDIVWLVEQNVTLPDGQVTKALVPQVYVRVQDGDLSPSGALIAGSNVNLNVGQDLVNSGTIAGRNVVALNAQNIQNLGGRIAGNDTAVQAHTDINNIGGTIEGGDSLTAIAGRNLNVASTTSTQTTAQGSRTNIDRVAALYVSKPGATLVASAGQDVNLNAAQIINAGDNGVTKIVAGNDLNLGTVTEARKQTIVWDAKNFRRDGDSQEVGTTVNTQGDVQLLAGNDLNARAASVTTANGALTAVAGNDVNITAGTSTVNVDEAHRHKSKSGWFSSKTVTTRDTLNATSAEASTFSGATVAVQADRDINIKGSNVVSTSATTLAANNNVNIEAATDTRNEDHFKKIKKSGLFGSGGFGFTIGSQEQSTEGNNTGKTAAASTVGSTEGDVNIYAGTNYRQVGSHVAAPQGDVSILANKVDIVAAQNTNVAVQETKFKQSGLTVAVTSPVISAIQTAQQMSQAAKSTSDARMQALAGATTGLAAKNAYDAIQSNPGEAGGINLSISIGGSKSASKTTQTGSNSAGSTVVAGRDVNIVATGAGSHSDITVQGSDINAGRNIVLSAEDEIKLQAAKSTADQHSNNKNSSGSIGISIGTSGFGVAASASAGRGNADGSDVNWNNTHVTAGNQVALQSGGDSSLKGAVVNGQQVVADVGGKLHIESLQDTSQYDSKQQSIGGSISVGYGKMGGSFNVSKSKINSDYASVTEQSGIKAGDDGFQVNVAGNTDLKGAVIASTDKAVEENKNSLVTRSLTTSDIRNSASYEGQSIALGVGYSTDGKGVGKDQQGQAQTGGAQTPGTTLPSEGGFSATTPIAMNASDDAASTTRSGISGAAVSITDAAKQKDLTGKDAATTIASINTDVSSDKDGSNALKPIFDEQEIQTKFEITAAFAREVGTFLDNRAKEVDNKKKQAAQNEQVAQDLGNGLTDEQRLALLDSAISLRTEAQQISEDWGSNGTYRQITTALVAAASGNVSGTSSQFAQNMLVNYVQQQGATAIGKLVENGTLAEGSPVHAALHAILACSGAAASGQNCGSGAMGAAASSALTGLFNETSPDETEAQREAKRNLITTIVAGIAAESGADASAATNSATAAVDNNWLATQQIVQMKKELKAETTLLGEAKVLGKWGYISGKQDVLTTSGIGKGLAESGWSDVKGLGAFLADPITGLQGLKELISSDSARQELGDSIFKELDAKIDRMSTALQTGGDQNAEQLGKDLGSLIWQVGSVVTGAGGLAKGGVALAKVGINLGTKGLEAVAAAAKFDSLVLKGGIVGLDGHPLTDFSFLTKAQKGVIGEIMGPQTVQRLIPDAQKIGKTVSNGQTGIDDLYKVSKPGVDYVVVEYKFGTSVLKTTKDGMQMSDDWLIGKSTNYDRILESVSNDPNVAYNITKSLNSGRVEKWVVHTDPAGGVSVWIVDNAGKIIKADSVIASKVLGTNSL